MKKLIYYVFLAVIAQCLAGQARGQQLRNLFSKTNSSVVVIRTLEKSISPTAQTGLVSLPGLGSGVLISSEGQILTAAHVVQAADYVSVEFVGGRRSSAHVVASYPRADIALVQVDAVPPDVVAAKLGDSDQMQVGDDV